MIFQLISGEWGVSHSKCLLLGIVRPFKHVSVFHNCVHAVSVNGVVVQFQSWPFGTKFPFNVITWMLNNVKARALHGPWSGTVIFRLYCSWPECHSAISSLRVQAPVRPTSTMVGQKWKTSILQPNISVRAMKSSILHITRLTHSDTVGAAQDEA